MAFSCFFGQTGQDKIYKNCLKRNYRRRFAPTVILPEVPKINNKARIIIGSYARMTTPEPFGLIVIDSLNLFLFSFLNPKPTLTGSDESELEYSGSSRAVKVPSRAELGHSNFRAETELTIWKQIFQISQFCFCIMISINFMIFF